MIRSDSHCLHMLCSRGQQTCVKGQIVNIFSIAGHTLSVTSTQLYHRSVKRAIHNLSINENGCVPIKFYLQTQAKGQTWPMGHYLLVLGLKYCRENMKTILCQKKMLRYKVKQTSKQKNSTQNYINLSLNVQPLYTCS